MGLGLWGARVPAPVWRTAQTEPSALRIGGTRVLTLAVCTLVASQRAACAGSSEPPQQTASTRPPRSRLSGWVTYMGTPAAGRAGSHAGSTEPSSNSQRTPRTGAKLARRARWQATTQPKPTTRVGSRPLRILGSPALPSHNLPRRRGQRRGESIEAGMEGDPASRIVEGIIT